VAWQQKKLTTTAGMCRWRCAAKGEANATGISDCSVPCNRKGGSSRELGVAVPVGIHARMQPGG
jgi:hypothetical protein